MKKIIFLLTVICVVYTSVAKADVSINGFAINNADLTNGNIYINPTNGGTFRFGFQLSRFLMPGGASSGQYEDGTCTITAVMQVGAQYIDISTPLSITNADWQSSVCQKVDVVATLAPRTSYGRVYLKIYHYNSTQGVWQTDYSGTSFGITTFSAGLAPGLQQFIVSSGVYTNDENKTKFFPSVTTPALISGQTITSPNGIYTLTFQADGNVVLYKNGTSALWSTRTQGTGAASLFFKTDGNLAVFNSSGTAVWASNRNNNISNLDNNYFYALQNDGNFVFYYTYLSQTGVKMFYALGTTNTAGGVVSPNSGFIK